MAEEVDDFNTDNLLPQKKRKADGMKKGNRTELELVKMLNRRFGGDFSRSVGSGNRWGQVQHLPRHAQEVFSGDLIVPEGFKWVLESKGGYQDIGLELDLRLRQQPTGRFSGAGGEGCPALRAEADAVLEAEPEAVAGVRADEGTGRPPLRLPAGLQRVVGGGSGGIAETARRLLLKPEDAPGECEPRNRQKMR